VRVAAIVQARMGSTRLPGKVLEEIEGRPMLWYVVHRTKLSAYVDDVVVATPEDDEDLAIHAACAEWGIPCVSWQGPASNVLARYVAAASSLDPAPTHVVRITADCPLIDAFVIDRTIEGLLSSGLPYASSVCRRTFPDGLDVEAMTARGLLELFFRCTDERDLEHVTARLYRPGAAIPVASIRSSGRFPGEDIGALRWTVDTAEDLTFVREVYRRLAPRWDFSWRDVLELGELAQRKAVA